MNKRQRKKQDKKRWSVTIEVGDTVEVVGHRYGGYMIRTLALVITPPPRQAVGMKEYDLCVSNEMDPHDPYAMIHHREDLKLFKKGTGK